MPHFLTNKKTRARFPTSERGPLRSLEKQLGRGVHQAEREKRGLTPDQPIFQVGTLVKTRTGLTGLVIGAAQYAWGWEYRIRPEGATRTVYREEHDLREAI